MSIYCDLYSYLKEYRDIGIKNSSSALYKHLKDNDISCFLVDCPSTLLLRENIVITIAGDSGTGKTTLSYKLKNYLEIKNKVLLYECDRYHKWSRGDINWKKITHLNPEANRIEQMKDDIIQLKANNSINQVEYDHSTGKFTEPQLIEPLSIVIVLGLHTILDSTLNKLSDCKIYIEPDYNLKTKWKIQRDNIERGYTIEQSLKSMEDRKDDYETYIKPQKDSADIVINYTESNVRLIIRQIFVSYLLQYKLKYEYKIQGEFFIIEKQSIEECFPLIEQIIFKGNK
jgi:uridine kinase